MPTKKEPAPLLAQHRLGCCRVRCITGTEFPRVGAVEWRRCAIVTENRTGGRQIHHRSQVSELMAPCFPLLEYCNIGHYLILGYLTCSHFEASRCVFMPDQVRSLWSPMSITKKLLYCHKSWACTYYCYQWSLGLQHYLTNTSLHHKPQLQDKAADYSLCVFSGDMQVMQFILLYTHDLQGTTYFFVAP